MEFEAIQGIATCHLSLGKFESAIQLSRDVLAKRLAFYKNDNHHFVLNSETNLAQALLMDGRDKDAEDILRVTYEKKKRILGEQHIDTNICSQALQSCLTRQRKFDDCIQFQANLSDDNDQASDAHKVSQYLISIQTQAIPLREKKRFIEMKQLLMKGLDLAKESYGENHLTTAGFEHDLGICLQDLNEIKQAETYLRASLKKRRALLGKHSNDTLLSMLELGKTLRLSSQLDESFDLLTAYIKAMGKQSHKLEGSAKANVNIAKKTIAQIYIENEEFVKAETLLHETIEAKYYDSQLSKEMPANFPWRKNEVKATPPPLPESSISGKSKKSAACLQFLRTMGISALNAHPDGIQLVDCLEECYKAQGKFEEAHNLLSDSQVNLFKAIMEG